MTVLARLATGVALTLSAVPALACSEPARLAPESAAAAPALPVPAAELSVDERDTIRIFERAAPSVCNITSIAVRRNLFSMRADAIPRGAGTCFVWDRRGHVVTNFHVIRGGDAFQVAFGDQSVWDAEVVGAAPEKDLAVLRVDAPEHELEPLAVGRSTELLVGQKVYAIGNPFGLDRTLTTGIISALGREIQSLAGIAIRDVVQTDAAINPGNSGGPLLDSAGRLIGVNTQILSTSGAYAGIGFAIPSDTVSWVVPELIAKGRIERPVLGVEMVSASRFLDVEGVLIVTVYPGSGAAEAGLRGSRRDRRGRLELGDIVVAVDGEKVETEDDLILALERRRAGERVALGILRDGREETLEVRLSARR